MKAGLSEGYSAELEILVEPSMFAGFDGKIIHNLYSTSALVYHMEWAARKTILPFLDEQEEGMGCRVNVEHKMPAPEGSRIKLIARVTDVHTNKVECQVEAFGPHGQIARGSVTQAIVEKSWLAEKLRELTTGPDEEKHSLV
ncbi:MAG: hypothetical protein K2X27_07500 [Candidatus Obscuribacterales bacterium]|nr:hypothetical protein [Candidatus Obscuribacterales bacterium]